jgi:hypothetical protein
MITTSRRGVSTTAASPVAGKAPRWPRVAMLRMYAPVGRALHPQPITQDRAPVNGAGRIHRHDPTDSRAVARTSRGD